MTVAILWTATPLSQYVDAGRLRGAVEELRRHDWAAAWVLLAYLGASPTFFPITLLNVITAVAFAPAQAFILCLAGSMLNAGLSFAMGRLLGRRWLRRYIGPRLAYTRAEPTYPLCSRKRRPARLSGGGGCPAISARAGRASAAGWGAAACPSWWA